MGHGYAIAWKDWAVRGALLVRIPRPSSVEHKWDFRLCHPYGSRVAVHGSMLPVTILDLNPWAERNARRFPRPARPPWWPLEKEDPKRTLGTEDAALPHAALSVLPPNSSLGQAPCGLAVDPFGFTEVVSTSIGDFLWLFAEARLSVLAVYRHTQCCWVYLSLCLTGIISLGLVRS